MKPFQESTVSDKIMNENEQIKNELFKCHTKQTITRKKYLLIQFVFCNPIYIEIQNFLNS